MQAKNPPNQRHHRHHRVLGGSGGRLVVVTLPVDFTADAVIFVLVIGERREKKRKKKRKIAIIALAFRSKRNISLVIMTPTTKTTAAETKTTLRQLGWSCIISSYKYFGSQRAELFMTFKALLALSSSFQLVPRRNSSRVVAGNWLPFCAVLCYRLGMIFCSASRI